MKGIILITIILLISTFVFGEVEFSDLNLSEDNIMLFKAKSEAPVIGEFTTLFRADLNKKGMGQYTYFPENIMLVGDDNAYQISNRYGVFRSNLDFTKMSLMESFHSFVKGDEILSGKISTEGISPDSKYIVVLSSSSGVRSDLLLYDIETTEKLIISEDIEISLSGLNFTWSMNSKFLVYSKNNNLYYYSIDQLKANRVIAEKYRKIGSGKISNIKWGHDHNLYYVKGSSIYKVLSEEVFTRSFYTDLFEIGVIVGKIPFNFESNFDNFWISPDGKKIVLNRGGRNIYLYYLSSDDYRSTGDTMSLPYLYLPRNTRVKKLLWSHNDIISLLTGSIVRGQNYTSVFRLNLAEKKDIYAFEQTEDKDILDFVFSEDYNRVAILYTDKVEIRNHNNWAIVNDYKHNRPLKALWRSNDELVVAGFYKSELINIKDGTRKMICLSQAGKYGFALESKNVQVKLNDDVFEFDDSGYFKEIDALTISSPTVASNSYRAYMENSSIGSYKNMVMIRDIKGFGTSPLFRWPERKYEKFPETEETVDSVNFNHGSRIRRREVSLVFNAIDNVEGLTPILNTLADYGIKCTFFINGEFIKRNPGAVREIADSGQEVGSLFYAYFNMTDSRFKVDKDFIKLGLARNEDEYFSVTGKELSLMWHAPYYFVNNDIITASREMNYSYVGRDVDTLDWVSFKDSVSSNNIYMPAVELIERALSLKKPGSIIPIKIGKTDGLRDDYLFHNLDLLINGLISYGYDIVPVSKLLEHSK